MPKLLLSGILALTSPVLLQPAHAQSTAQINNTVRTLERNRDFRSLNANIQTLNAMRQNLATAERTFSRSTCQTALNAGQILSRDCQTLARQILGGRRDVSALEEKVQAGQAIARQREQLLARRGTGPSTAVVNRRAPNFFEQLFGSFSGNSLINSQTIFEEEMDPSRFGTVRSVCVRKSDGYYWPVSFSTVPEYLANDAAQCNAQCPGKEVDLYYYSNPGQNPNDMVNLSGRAYTSLPTAFNYRTEYNLENSCSVKVEVGKIELVEVAGNSRAFLSAGGINLPLPLRDPRRVIETIVAEIIQISLPRPRPLLDGEQPGEIIPVLSAELRVVELNGKIVRLVGPDTPYGQSVEAGS